jgi:hypothetical protein
MNAEENWLTEVISKQKRIVILSFTFLALTAVSISLGLSLFWYEAKIFDPFDPSNPPPVILPNYKGLATSILAVAMLLLIGGVYLWEFYTPAEVQNQLHSLQELFSASMKSKRREHQFQLPDGFVFTVRYTPYRWAAQSWCGFQLQYSPPGRITDAMRREALRGGLAPVSPNVLSAKCSLEEFYPRTLLLYKTIRRIRRLQN